MPHHFFAFLSRLRYIQRWSLMHSHFPENVAEHTLMTAILAHGLALIRRDVFGLEADPERAAAFSLFHDAPEIFTGDLPTPVKYDNPAIREAYAAVEAQSASQLLSFLPEKLQPSYSALLSPPSPEEALLIHAADKLSANLKCVEEERSGNAEFKLAAEQTLSKLKAMDRPEVDYFLKEFLPSFKLTLDELR